MSKKNLIYSECYGCASNKSDYGIMLKILKDQGFKFTNRLNDGEVLILNTCGVKEVTENRMLWKIKRLSLTGKPLIITGCLPKINFKKIQKSAPTFSAVLDPFSIDKITSAVINALDGNIGGKYFRDEAIEKSKFPKIRLNK